jgi:hypothetical protein
VADDIQIDLSLDEDDEIEINRTMDEAALNKTMLYDGWLQDFEEK